MGSTIRRQPLSFKIPASPDYQFLNVLNFNGLNMTDNPFTADVTTASDCLNVYVDEANALATRPRLELFYDLHKKHPGMTKLLGVYPLSIGYLFHYIENGSYALDIAYDVSNTLTFVNVDTLTHGVNPKVDTLSVFEQNDKIYVLSGEGYYFITYTKFGSYIIRAEIDSVEGYVPTTRVGKSNTQDGSVFEDLNILSNKYKESYFWDGTWNIENLKHHKNTKIENNYIVKDTRPVGNYNVIKYLPNYDLTKNNDFFLITDNSGENNIPSLQIGVYSTPLFKETGEDDEIKFISPPSDLPEGSYYGVYANASDDGKFIAALYLPWANTNTQGCLYVRRNDVWYQVISDSSHIFEQPAAMSYSEFVGISNDGNIVICCAENKMIVCLYDSTEDKYVVLNENVNSVSTLGLHFSKNCASAVLTGTNDNGKHWIRFYKNLDKLTSTSVLSSEEIIDITQPSFWGYGFSENGSQLMFIDSNDCVRYYDKYNENNNFISIPISKFFKYTPLYNDVMFIFSSDDSRIYFIGSNENGWVMLNEEFTIVKLNESLLGVWGYVSILYGQHHYATPTNLYFFDCHANDKIIAVNFDYSNNEPLLIVTKILLETDEHYSEWREKRTKFLKSSLTTRFNNERWFSSGNSLYYTSYNDPTYIGLYDYSDLGESDEPITGFNLAQDDLLIVYKDNKINTVRYGEISDGIYSYIYSDSKNTVGNNALGGSIVSILTEMPLQISYDGIYALKQLDNVQSDARISELISERINKKWLTEKKEVIRNCKTINRLYWTYFILSEKDYSKIYLLDNRTQSWYYWELPIVILNAFIKNNTTYFSDIDGNLYTLKTTDLFNKFNPEITEYYDEGKKLIKWSWKSQILPMKTINYSKKLVSTTFIMSDTDEKDEYGLNYKFKAFRKTASQTQETTLTNNINYIVSTTKRTLVPRFNFMQIELSNIEGTSDDFDHNKLRLIGLAFKYVLLEGLV